MTTVGKSTSDGRRKSPRASAARQEASDMQGHLLDAKEAAAALGLKSERTLYKWAYAGRMPSVKIGRLLRFRRCDVERLISDGHRPAFTDVSEAPLTGARAVRYRG